MSLWYEELRLAGRRRGGHAPSRDSGEQSMGQWNAGGFTAPSPRGIDRFVFI